MEPELVLRGLFAHLVDHGFRLGVRDYLDALRALRAGYGGYTRPELLRLCQCVWARSETEVRTLALLFERLPLPAANEVAELTGAAPPAGRSQRQRAPKAGPASTSVSPSDEAVAAVGISFVAVPEGAWMLPRARVGQAQSEVIILTPRQVVPLRALIIAWRRFRTTSRAGPRMDLDLEATVAAKCRTGVLEAPVLTPTRQNQARLVVLVDASRSMQTWHGFNEVLNASLRQGQLGEWALFYFDNVPDILYRDDLFLHPEPLERAVQRHAGSTLLLVSDAGAARGEHSRERVCATERFLSLVSPGWRPAVWVNPMGRARWKGTSAEAVSRLRNVSMFELTEAGMIEAVDTLRGRAAC